MGRLHREWPSESDRQRTEEKNRRHLLDNGFAPEKVETILRQREAQWHRFRRRHEERERVRAEFGDFFTSVNHIITQHDPLGLIWPGDPPEYVETEYDNVVGTILPRLRDTQTVEDVSRIVDEEFGTWFGKDVMQLPHRQARMQGLAEEIWHAWCQRSDK